MVPRSETTVSRPCGKLAMKSRSSAAAIAFSRSSSGMSELKAMFSRSVMLNRMLS